MKIETPLPSAFRLSAIDKSSEDHGRVSEQPLEHGSLLDTYDAQHAWQR